jgi:[glutamine synthetase] adenylyltransferase / [glutamine synthetase]-adenylyl-L-tyrosine phosphorylase
VGALLSGAPDRGTSDQLRAGQAALGLSDSDLAALLDADRLMWGVQAATRLMTAGSLDADAIGAGGRALLLREAGAPDIPGLEAALSRDAAAADRIASTALADEG